MTRVAQELDDTSISDAIQHSSISCRDSPANSREGWCPTHSDVGIEHDDDGSRGPTEDDGEPNVQQGCSGGVDLPELDVNFSAGSESGTVGSDDDIDDDDDDDTVTLSPDDDNADENGSVNIAGHISKLHKGVTHPLGGHTSPPSPATLVTAIIPPNSVSRYDSSINSPRDGGEPVSDALKEDVDLEPGVLWSFQQNYSKARSPQQKWNAGVSAMASAYAGILVLFMGFVNNKLGFLDDAAYPRDLIIRVLLYSSLVNSVLCGLIAGLSSVATRVSRWVVRFSVWLLFVAAFEGLAGLVFFVVVAENMVLCLVVVGQMVICGFLVAVYGLNMFESTRRWLSGWLSHVPR
ncbi:hypothetical protein PLICRDRAFT_621097 [Plicaturopsis crispa FD-325 SS-3]|nr:hypothetical protein PLICRDRAFT_621097 [Plicaturopsis crispa FD-325 SS-3]